MVSLFTQWTGPRVTRGPCRQPLREAEPCHASKSQLSHKEDPNFVAEWEKATWQCEQRLMATLIDHLSKIETLSNNTIREAAKLCYNTLMGIFPDRAKDALQDILQKSERNGQSPIRGKDQSSKTVAALAAKIQSRQLNKRHLNNFQLNSKSCKLKYIKHCMLNFNHYIGIM